MTMNDKHPMFFVLGEMLKEYGIKKVIAGLLAVANIVDGSTAGQVTIHINNGGVTKIVRSAEVR